MNPPKPFDLHRIVLLNHLPWTFMLEVVLRMGTLYLVLLIAMRLMGQRMASQTTRNELAALVSLAGGIGPAIQDPKQGLVPPLVVAAVVVGLQRLVSWQMAKNERFERLTLGQMTLLVCDGAFDIRALELVAISRERLVTEMRSEGIRQLGAVDRLYFELNGAFTLITTKKPRPGLSLVPALDKALRAKQPRAKDRHACLSCGLTQTFSSGRCPACGAHDWEPAVVG